MSCAKHPPLAGNRSGQAAAMKKPCLQSSTLFSLRTHALHVLFPRTGKFTHNERPAARGDSAAPARGAAAGAAVAGAAAGAEAAAGALAADLLLPPSLQADNTNAASNAGSTRIAIENTMLFSE